MFGLKRTAAVAAFVVAVSAAMVGMAAGPAAAGTTGTELSGAVSGLYLEVPGWSTGAGVALDQWISNSITGWTGYTGKNQRWSLPGSNDGGVNGKTGYIKNEYSGMCITTDGTPGDPVVQWPCNGQANQQWSINSFYYMDWANFPSYTYYFHIVNPVTQLALNVRWNSTSNGAYVIGWPLNGENTKDNQSWSVTYAH